MAAEIFANPDFAPVHLTSAQILILETMWKDGGNMPQEVAAILKVAPSTVQAQLGRIKGRLKTRHWFASFIRFQEHRGTILAAHDIGETSGRAASKLNIAEALMREVMSSSAVTKWSPPGAVPQLLIALEALAKARAMVLSIGSVGTGPQV